MNYQEMETKPNEPVGDDALERLRAELLRIETHDMPAPMPMHELLQSVRQRRGPTVYGRRCRAAVGQWLMAAALVAVCVLLGHRAIVCDTPLLLLPVLSVGVPALWQVAAESYRVYLLWHLAPSRHAPAVGDRYALRLWRMQDRCDRWRQRLQRCLGRMPRQPRHAYRYSAALLGCCLLVAVSVFQRPATTLSNTTVSCAYMLCGNGDCGKPQVLGELGTMFYTRCG